MAEGSPDKKQKALTFPRRGLPWFGMASSPRSSSRKSKLQQQANNNSPYSSGSDSTGNSPAFQRRTGRRASEDTDSVDGLFFKRFGESYSVHNPRSALHLLSLLQQKGTALLFPDEDGDNPLHSIVRLARPEKEKEDLLVTLLTHSFVDINSHGKGGMTALHYAVQANEVGIVKLLLAFGADVNLVNHRHHTPLDIATYSWLAHERQSKIRIGREFHSMPDVTSPPMPSPLLLRKTSNVTLPVPSPRASPRMNRTNGTTYTRQGSTSSWVYVDQDSAASSNGENGVEKLSVEPSSTSTDDSREFLSSVMPIKPDDFAEEVLDGALPSSAQTVLSSFGALLSLLYSVHALSGKAIKHRFNDVPPLSSFSESVEFQEQIDTQKHLNPFWDSSDLENSVKIRDFIEGKTVLSLYEELEYNINLRLTNQNSLSPNPDEAIAVIFQQKEMMKYKGTMKGGIGFEVNGGSRLLFLDGGGIKGLVQIEVMRQLEAATGRKITELFDWIIGASIGGILALGLVYAKKSLQELRQMIFKLRDEVFARPRAGIAFNSKALEKMVTQEFGFDLTMSQVKRPKVLVAAVNKKTAPPQLHFFNNCFQDRFSNAPVWKVARYTTAAPIFFTEFEDYVDGGVLANNPCDYGLTAIQNFHREVKVDLPISMVVSIGTGIYPPEEVGRIDAQEFLFFGKHWFSFTDNIKSRTQNLISLLTNALVESEMVAKSCSMRCHEQGIPYYRFSPQLNHVIGAGETDVDKLVDMIVQTRIQAPHQGITELASLFQLVANASKKSKYRRSRILTEQDQNAPPHDDS